MHRITTEAASCNFVVMLGSSRCLCAAAGRYPAVATADKITQNNIKRNAAMAGVIPGADFEDLDASADVTTLAWLARPCRRFKAAGGGAIGTAAQSGPKFRDADRRHADDRCGSDLSR